MKMKSAVQIRKKIKIFSPSYFLTLLFCFCAALVYAGAGKTGAEFLLIGTGARASAMGESSLSLADGINTVCGNPSGLAQVRGREISAMHNEWLNGIQHEFIGYGHFIPHFGTLGISIVYLHTSAIEGRSISSAKTGNFSAYDLSTGLSLGRKFSENISFGSSIKFIQQKIEEEKANGLAIDIGGLYKIGENKKMAIAAAILNMGTKMKFVKEKYSLPLTLSMGASYKHNPIFFTLNIKRQVIEKCNSLSMGAEYQIASSFALRGGYLMGEKNENLFGFTTGLGFKLYKCQIDYAFIPSSDLGNTHQISLTTKF